MDHIAAIHPRDRAHLVCLALLLVRSPARWLSRASPSRLPRPRQADSGDAPDAGPGAAPKGKRPSFDFTGLDLTGKLRTPQLLYFLERANEELERGRPRAALVHPRDGALGRGGARCERTCPGARARDRPPAVGAALLVHLAAGGHGRLSSPRPAAGHPRRQPSGRPSSTPTSGLPDNFAILRPGTRGYVLTLGTSMRGRLRLDGQERDVADFVAAAAAAPRRSPARSARRRSAAGDWGVIDLDGDRRTTSSSSSSSSRTRRCRRRSGCWAR